MRFRLTTVLAFGLATAAWGQQSAPPQAKAADSGPSLAATMQFIQEKLGQTGKIAWIETIAKRPGMIIRFPVTPADAMADPASCSLYTTATVETTVELPKGTTLKSGANADDLHTQIVETSTTSFKQIEKITVEKLQDLRNAQYAGAGHPDLVVDVAPPLFAVKLWASTAVFTGHTTTTKGSQAPVEKDTAEKTSDFVLPDEETANRVAKAMSHAMELCGGGPKKELF
jgi:hypothetical protein